MDLTLSRRGDYVVRAAISLARAYQSGRYRKIREVAAEVGLPKSYTPQILKMLANAGLAEAMAGVQGGYRLARDPDRISLLEVVEAGEGALKLGRCTLRGGPCHWERMCPLHPSWEEAARAMKQSLRGTSLAFVAQIDWGLEAGDYVVPAETHEAKTPRNQ